MSTRNLSIAIVLGSLFTPAIADEVLQRYEGDVLPYQAPGWIIADPCEPPCSESLEDGHFVLFWSEPNDLANYSYRIAAPPDAPQCC